MLSWRRFKETRLWQQPRYAACGQKNHQEICLFLIHLGRQWYAPGAIRSHATGTSERFFYSNCKESACMNVFRSEGY